MDLPKEFFTIQSMATLAGASGATFVICNGLQRAFNFNPKWLALAIAILIAFFGVYETTANKASDYFIGLVNGFLIFCTAAGGTAAVAPKNGDGATARGNVPKLEMKKEEVPKRQFTTSWFKN